MNTKLLSVVLLALVLAGCASGVKRPQTAEANRPCLSDREQVSSVSVSLTEDAKKKALDNLKFNPDELLSHVKRGLEANNLLNGTGDLPRPHLEVQVKDMRIRSNFSAVMWGFMAGADSITADIVLADDAGKELDRFEVSASYALGGLAGGQDSAQMGWLYEKFAEETVKELTKQQ
ncbi:MAG: DUF4410 domain-containing protein [Desulfovibrionales bacterium]|nr:DUF4410 domain-containing protein [Desulfovibrionales bacterium]